MKETIEKNVVTSKQENKQQENNTNEQQDTNMENNEQENAILNENIINNKSVIDTIITALSGMIVNYEKYNVMQNDVMEMKSVINTIKNENIKNTMLAELHNMENNAENERKNATKNAQTEIIVYIMEKLDLSCNTKKSSNSKKSNVSNEKTEKSAYTAKMAIMDNVSNEWQSLKMICDSIEKQNKLPSIHTNDGWKRTISTAIIGLIENGSIVRNDKHEYKLA